MPGRCSPGARVAKGGAAEVRAPAASSRHAAAVRNMYRSHVPLENPVKKSNNFFNVAPPL